MANRWRPVHYLSWADTENPSWVFWTDEPGYDRTKHEPNDQGEVIFPIDVPAEPGSTVKTHWEYEPLTQAEAEEILAAQQSFEPESVVQYRPISDPVFEPEPQVDIPEWRIERFLSFEESQHGYSSDPRNVPGFDTTKHDMSPMPFNQYINPSVDPADGERGHFEYHPLDEYSAGSGDVNPPTIPTVDTETHLDVVLGAGEGVTWIYWQPDSWQPPEWDPERVSDTYDEYNFVKVADMDSGGSGVQGVITTMDNKIFLYTGTDPAQYDVEEWDDNLGKYRLIMRRHDSIPADKISRAIGDPDMEDVTIVGAHFDGDEGALNIQISDQGFLLETNFKILPGGCRMLVTGFRRREARGDGRDRHVAVRQGWRPSRGPKAPPAVVMVSVTRFRARGRRNHP